ncbi:disulfide bond formation protein B [Pacificimonas flava]|uniref:Disulfide bond formation protein B n=2 Tax=Pacificimonas TaxID=1960290 RepID=A0A219B1J5_9SPHN|nr:disulfide bond formation protein B [Pacificimonas flava]MBZ6378177.1 disulfide bond formation protein B [Pacificimonas aurantium]OWV32195.1 disulfide bond formation protein B [Pacificimonas flava]
MTNRAHLLLLIGPTLLLGGALISQHVFGLYPCEMCVWQRWPHAIALLLATLAFMLAQGLRWPVLVLSALFVLASGVIGVFHAGVEYGWWDSPLGCTAVEIGGSGDFLRDIAAAPLVRCDVAAWDLFGISLAGYNAIFSFLIAGVSLWWMRTRGLSR